MATTGTQIVTDRVRYIIEDTSLSPTWSDAVLMAFLNDGQAFIKDTKLEEQLASPNSLTSTFAELTALAQNIFVPDRYREALVDYVCARAFGMDGQDKRDKKRAQEHMDNFLKKAGIPAGASIGGRMG